MAPGRRVVRAAALQMEPVLGDVAANLDAAERLAGRAAAAGADWIVLPEFFTTGIAFLPALARAALPVDGEAAALLRSLAARHGAHAGGSFLCRDDDGQVRNAFLLAGPDGTILGRHDKDLPTMWENAFYTGGADDGVIAAGDVTVGVALCWELMRSATLRRLRRRADVVVGGSGWWSVPAWRPHAVTRRWEAANARTAVRAAPCFAALAGAPVIHGAHTGPLACPMPWVPLHYRGRFEGGASVSDAHGRLLAFRAWEEGAGVAIADVELDRVPPRHPVPERYWLHRRGPLPTLAWHYQRAHGRRWYRRHVA